MDVVDTASDSLVVCGGISSIPFADNEFGEAVILLG